MRIINIVFLVVCLIESLAGYSQAIFPEKFDGCITDRFALESDSTTAKIQDAQLIEVIVKSFDNKTKEKVRGELSVQIIVDLDGNSCLISLKNDTNIKTRNLNIKQYIDQALKWDKPRQKVAAIVVYKFEKNIIKFKRLGLNAKRGVHELKPN
jgi:hypothetical protein